MVQVSGLLFLLFTSVCVVAVGFVFGMLLIKIRDYYLRNVFQSAFVFSSVGEKERNSQYDVVRESNYSYDTKRIGEKTLRRNY